MTLLLNSPPKCICLLRLSAIGDVTHVLPTIRSLQQFWPETRITWIIGKLEYQLVGDIPDIEFIIFDKSLGWRAHLDLWRKLRKRRFDILLHMQVALRASLASLLVTAPVRVGYDSTRSKDFQRWFCNTRINAVKNQHVLDGFLEFIKALGVKETVLTWDIPIPEADRQWAEQLVDERPLLIVNPSSSKRLRNWRSIAPSLYAEVIEYAVNVFGSSVILTGGPADHEYTLAESILNQGVIAQNPSIRSKVANLVGRTSLKQLAALMTKAKLVIAPDTGPAHIANALGVPVIGLYATSNPYRTGPYCSLKHTVNQYPEAVGLFFNKSVDELPWGKRIRDPQALELITFGHIREKLDEIMKHS
ncbi:MAG: heptosyltransferase I [Cellvibrionaceae bacterium]|jgi:heptosyltransferase I